ncbi:MAG: ABC transporter permease [Caldilineaceae bacterium]|nr:ABC transporter permease [Caldilineaceae bacterium]HRJ40609.1 ABC transporter permease [Caldilineaceae bacterium]
MTSDIEPIPGDVADQTLPISEESRVNVATQWQLMWWKFRKHRLAMLGGVVTILIYLVTIFVEFLAPFPPVSFAAKYTYAPPQPLHLFEETENGLKFAPYVNGYKVEIEQAALRRVFTVDPEAKHYVGLLVNGAPYKLLGILPTDVHLLGPKEPDAPMYLLGADKLGRDVFSRLLYGTRISMSIGLVGVALSFLLGILLGGISGYYGGTIDNVIQRVIEFIRSIPTIPLWLGLAAALPSDWPPLRIYFGITIILSFIGWTELARVVRGRFLALRTEDFVLASRLEGSSEMRIIWKHMVPSFMSHIIASLTLAIPGMILAETSLSFLGLGLRPPIVSWGVLLQEAQNIRAVATAPWLLVPGAAVVIAVLALNFLGDGLRDAADPYR